MHKYWVGIVFKMESILYLSELWLNEIAFDTK